MKAHLYNFTSGKAGMGGVDKAKVNQVIHDMSKGSAFYAHANAQDAKTNQRIEAFRTKLSAYTRTPQLRLSLAKKAATQEFQLERKRFLGRPCVVVDMDMFFAAVEIRDNPKLASVRRSSGEPQATD
jgi:hypothetical protein